MCCLWHFYTKTAKVQWLRQILCLKSLKYVLPGTSWKLFANFCIGVTATK
jgi:hypothetical protein